MKPISSRGEGVCVIAQPSSFLHILASLFFLLCNSCATENNKVFIKQRVTRCPTVRGMFVPLYIEASEPAAALLEIFLKLSRTFDN